MAITIPPYLQRGYIPIKGEITGEMTNLIFEIPTFLERRFRICKMRVSGRKKKQRRKLSIEVMLLMKYLICSWKL